ncbi:hypothetical protein [Micromonospora sp. NPDC023814]
MYVAKEFNRVQDGQAYVDEQNVLEFLKEVPHEVRLVCGPR